MTLRGQKATMYEGGIRVPGIMEWPARIQQARSTQLTSVTSDILPTLCELYNIQTDPSESRNLAASHPDLVETMQNQLHDWQQSVLQSLTGADYN